MTREVGRSPRRSQRIIGWAAVLVSTMISGFWAYWGIIENFHEGWYHPSLARNLMMLFGQYLSPLLVFVVAAVVAIRWPRPGGALHVAGAGFVMWFFRGASPVVLFPFLVGPLALMGVMYWFGRATPRRWAIGVVLGVVTLTLIGFGIEPAFRVAARIDDGDRGPRRLTQDGVDLVWAPAGPGWPTSGVTWAEAVDRSRHLAADGTTLADTPQDIWRLPTVDEAVRSMRRHDEDSGGVWDPATLSATYQRRPDKESPLWDTQSQVIYWWTATEIDAENAYIVVYNGGVWPRRKSASWGYLGFRAVRTP